MEMQGEDLAVASERSTCVSDRRLLELAALAAWIETTPHPEGGGRLIAWHQGTAECVEWNPLTDDGDAFRLAAELRLDICRPSATHDVVCVWVDHMGDFVEELHGSDPCAATRRAIVRAAAEIGRTLENAGAQPNAPIK